MKSVTQPPQSCQAPPECDFGKKPNKLKALFNSLIYPFLPEGADWEPPKGDEETWGEFA